MEFNQRIAVVGTFRSGKTVFLTSLINQLEEHSPSDFAFGNKASISKFRIEKPAKELGAEFDYSGYRDSLVHQGKWPRKTRDASHFICSFDRSDWSVYRPRIHFFDFPGERAADAAIVAFDDYGQWSDYICKHFQTQTAYRDLAKEYLELVERTQFNAEEVLHAYKLALARAALACRPLISPSTFLLDCEGSHAPKKSAEELATRRCSGLPADSQSGKNREFAPLPDIARGRKPDIVDRFALGFKDYREQVALPIFAQLRGCHRIIVLFDIPSLLVAGVGAYNDNRETVKLVFDALNAELPLGERISSMISKWWLLWLPAILFKDYSCCLDRVAFVANKADLVHPDDVKSGRLVALLKQMTERLARDLDVESEWFACSAAVSAKAAKDQGCLRGTPVYNNPDNTPMVFSVSPLPERWPTSWPPPDFEYQPVRPNVPAAHHLAPEHFGLDKVFDFVSRD